jgi:electron transfer flavoprotein beta subunit
LKIVVLVKQVPRTDKIKIDKEKGILIRKGVESILNPYCEYALDLAVKLKNKYCHVHEITALTMGPPLAENVLRRALSLGADKGVLLSDKAFSGSDCWATAYTLSKGLEKIGNASVIICGKQAIDGDTAQVPGEISEITGIPVLPYVVEINELNPDKIVAVCEFENELIVMESQLPIIITIGGGSNIRRIPSVGDVEKAFKSDTVILDKNEAGCNDSDIGLNGSPTRVVKIEPAVSDGECEMFDELDFDQGFEKVKSILMEKLHEKN